MSTLNKYKLSFKHFLFFVIVLIIFLLGEGLISNHYQIFTYYYYSELRYDRAGYNPLIWEENGIVEFAQVILLFLSITILLRYIKLYLKDLKKFFQIVLILYLIGLTYYFFEEISYGQHLFFWKTPEFFSNLNTQNETNFHNMSNLLNELPRTLLLLFCSLSFLFAKLINSRSKYLSLFLFPNSKLIYITFLILIFVLPNLILDIFDIKPFFLVWELDKHPWNFSIDIFQLLSFNFIRLSELQELLFNFYIINHVYYLKNIFNFK